MRPTRDDLEMAALLVRGHYQTRRQLEGFTARERDRYAELRDKTGLQASISEEVSRGVVRVELEVFR